MVARFHPGTDWTSATAGTDDGHVVFTPNVNIAGGAGAYTGPLAAQFPATLGAKTGALSFSVVPNTDTPFPVTGTFFQATQPVSGTVTANLGTIAGVATETTLAAASAKLPASLGAKAANASLSVSNSFLTAAALGDGSVDTAESITVANTVQVVEFFNLSANVIWASWTGTAAAATTGSFPIPALASGVAGYYSAPPGASGTLSIIAVGGASAFTCIGWS